MTASVLGRAVIPSRKRILILLAWHATNTFRGIAKYAKDAGWVIDSRFDRSGEIPKNWKGDGVIGVLGIHPEVDAFTKKCRMPFVNIGYSLTEAAPRVAADQHLIARLAASHFRNRGFRKFCYYIHGSQPGDLGRCEAFREALAQHGETLSIIDGRTNRAGTSDARERWLSRKILNLPKPSALFAEIDDYAVEVLEAAIQAGVSIPDELAVLGVGNDEFRCPFSSVPLSSVDDNGYGIGQQAAVLLEQLMTKASLPRLPLLVPPLGVITRRSTDVLAVEHPMVARAIKTLREKYHLPLTAEGMIADIPMSRRRLHDAFLRAIGRSVADELTRLRIEHAKRSLAESDIKLGVLSRECGFNSQARLVIVFSKSTGMTPGEYRHAFNPDFSKSPKPGRPRSPKT